MSKAYSIRQPRTGGGSTAEISGKLAVPRDAVYKHLAMEGLPQKPPTPRGRSSVPDRCRPLVESWLDEDERNWRKQRHTAHRIWARLRDEAGADVGESTVRDYVGRLEPERGTQREQYLDLDWAPGGARAGFGEAGFYVGGVRTRKSLFVMTFPCSNVGIARVFPGGNAECACQALRNILEHAAGVPGRIAFDNAAGVGRRVGGAVRATETLSAFAAHYGSAYSLCSPSSGHEKGGVENEAGYARDNLFAPVPQFMGAGAFNAKPLDRPMAPPGKRHWVKGENELQLFAEDRFAMPGLPPAPLSVVRYEARKADKLGKARLDGPRLYSSGPSLAGSELVCGIGAATVTVATRDGAVAAERSRAYGDAPTDAAGPASQLALLCQRPGAWASSKVRGAVPDGLREHMGSLGKPDLKAGLRLMRDQAATSGRGATVRAMRSALPATGRVDRASAAAGAARISGGSVEYDEKVGLSAYDSALASARGRRTWGSGAGTTPGGSASRPGGCSSPTRP